MHIMEKLEFNSPLIPLRHTNFLTPGKRRLFGGLDLLLLKDFWKCSRPELFLHRIQVLLSEVPEVLDG